MNATNAALGSPLRGLAVGSSVARVPLVRALSVALIAVISFGLWAVRWRGPIDLRFDASVYYVLGTSLAEGHGYRLISEPGAPEDIQYPPLLPLIVAAHQRVLGSTDPAIVGPALRHSYAVMFLLYALAVLALARSLVRPWLALIATLLCLGQVNTYLFSDLLFTELPFALVTVSFVLLLSTRRFAQWPRAREILTFVLAAAGFFLRTAGIALLFTWVMEALLRRAWRVAILRGLLAVLPMTAWQLHVVRVQRTTEYQTPAYSYQRAPYQFYNVTYGANMALVDPFRPELGRVTPLKIAERIAANIAILPVALGEAASESIGFWRAALQGIQETSEPRSLLDTVARLPLYLLSLLILAGGVVLVRKRRWAPVILTIASIGLVCTTPWPEQVARYFTPTTPFLTIGLVVGLAATLDLLRRQRKSTVIRVGRAAVVGFVLVILGVQLHSAYLVFRQRHYEAATFVPGRGIDAPRWFYFGTPWAEWEKAVRWVDARAERSDIVVTNSPHLCYLWTGLKAVMPPMEIDATKARQLLDNVSANWVIIDDLKFLDISTRYALPAISGENSGWRLVQRFGRTSVYQRVQAPEPQLRVADLAPYGESLQRAKMEDVSSWF